MSQQAIQKYSAETVKKDLIALKEQLLKDGQIQVTSNNKIIIYQLNQVIGIGAEALVFSASKNGVSDIIALRFSYCDALLNIEATVDLQLHLKDSLYIQQCFLMTKVQFNGRDLYIMELEYVEKCLSNVIVNKHDIPLYICQLCQAIQYLQDKNIIHRDIKQENILIDTTAKIVKLTDFGFAKQSSDKPMPMVGTMLYMPPEAFLEVDYNEQEDIGYSYINQMFDNWSIGVLIYVLYQKTMPFKTQTDIIQKQLDNESDFNEFDNEILKNICKSLLHKQPEHRMTMKEVLLYLQEDAI